MRFRLLLLPLILLLFIPSISGAGNGPYTAQDVFYPTSNAVTTYTSTSDYPPSVWSFNGSVVSLDGVTYSSSLAPADIKADASWVSNTTAEYFEFSHYANLSTGLYIFGHAVPDCYMGMDIWQNSSLMTGQTNYTLSVPYLYNGSTAPVKDWNTLGVTTPSNTTGAIYRVQLSINSSATQVLVLKVRIYYATSPAVGSDGVNDRIRINMTVPMNITQGNITAVYKPWSVVPDWNKYIWAGWDWYIGVSDLHSSGYEIYFGFEDNASAPYDCYFKGNNVVGAQNTLTATLNNTHIATWNNGSYNSKPCVGVYMRNDSASINLFFTDYNKYCKAIFYHFEIRYVDDDLRLLYNASSFNSSGYLNDYSAYGTVGNAYGNMQYKVYTGTGFRVSVASSASGTTQTTYSHYWDQADGTTTYQYNFSYPEASLNCTVPIGQNVTDVFDGAGYALPVSAYFTEAYNSTHSVLVLNSMAIATYGINYKFTTVLTEVLITSGMSYISFVLLFAFGMISLLLSFYCTDTILKGRQSVGALIFPVLSAVLWGVLAFSTFTISMGVITFVDWIPAMIYMAVCTLSALLTVYNIFAYIGLAVKSKYGNTD